VLLWVPVSLILRSAIGLLVIAAAWEGPPRRSSASLESSQTASARWKQGGGLLGGERAAAAGYVGAKETARGDCMPGLGLLVCWRRGRVGGRYGERWERRVPKGSTGARLFLWWEIADCLTAGSVRRSVQGGSSIKQAWPPTSCSV
jgi:hypothetical protein